MSPEAGQSAASLVSAGKLTPRPHQREAIKGIRKVLERKSRTKVVMACGSGKTLVEFAIANDYDKVVVLAPSLALIAQSLNTARAYGTTRGRSVLCVCSDRSVIGADEWRVQPDELGIPVTTDLIETRRELEGSSRLLVFCTYQSAPLLMEALPARFRFDLAVYDEAHRTAGARDRLFSRALSDDGLPARKRLFATATPRHMAPSAHGGLESALVYSMDDESVYGELAYQLTLSDAVERSVCSDYQVLIACVTAAKQRTLSVRGRELLLPQPQAPVDEVAMQLAVARACEDTALAGNPYHRTIEDARDFAEDLRASRPGRDHGVSHQRRDARCATRSVVAGSVWHARARNCSRTPVFDGRLDVPSIDMVSFCFNKQSHVDIVQAVGRGSSGLSGTRQPGTSSCRCSWMQSNRNASTMESKRYSRVRDSR